MLLAALALAAQAAPTAPVPLFRDPVHDGAADPVTVHDKKTGEWGLAYDASQDLGKVEMKMSKPAAMVEELKYTIEAAGAKGTLTLAWENHAASVSISAK